MRHKPNILRFESARAHTTELVVRGWTRVVVSKTFPSQLWCVCRFKAGETNRESVREDKRGRESLK